MPFTNLRSQPTLEYQQPGFYLRKHLRFYLRKHETSDSDRYPRKHETIILKRYPISLLSSIFRPCVIYVGTYLPSSRMKSLTYKKKYKSAEKVVSGQGNNFFWLNQCFVNFHFREWSWMGNLRTTGCNFQNDDHESLSELMALTGGCKTFESCRPRNCSGTHPCSPTGVPRPSEPPVDW